MLERVRDDFITQGYVIKSEGDTGVLMTKHPWGSAAGWIAFAVIALILAVIGLAPVSIIVLVAYGLYSHYNAPEVMIRIDNQK
jgi:uncharacterized membrane protein (Fun14 family)